MKKNITFFALLLFAVMQGAFAQITITGKVINEEDGLAMPGVSVVVKGTTTGMATDTDGSFTLNVPNDATIVVSFMGFKSVELLVGTQTQFDVTLQTDVNVLGNVVVTETRNRVIPPERAVVTAMGIVRDIMSLPYSIGLVSRADIERFGGDVMAAINAKVPGFNNGQMRGQKSFNFPRGALWVLDGVPIGTEPPIINVEDIESITVLKSANAAILYGSQAANGAVIITLKWEK